MNNDILKSIETISVLVDGLDDLAQQLKAFTESYSGIQASVSAVRKIQEETAANMADTLPMMQSLMDNQLIGSQKIGQLTPALEVTSTRMQTVCDTFQEALKGLKEHQEALDATSEILSGLSNTMEKTPALAEASTKIQKALGAISDPAALQEISQKLDEQTQAIHQEREEIIEPLKNAAAFSEVVQTESGKLQEVLSSQFEDVKRHTDTTLEEQLQAFHSGESASVGSKLEQLLENTNQIRAILETAPQSASKQGGLMGLLGFKTKENSAMGNLTPKELLTNSICVIERKGWTHEYVFAVEGADSEYAYGCYYKYGEPYKDTKSGVNGISRCALNDGSYHFYENEHYLRMIQEKEYKRRYLYKQL